MLERGGNAVDAAIAAMCVSGVIEPMETTLAGSGFMLVGRPGEAPVSIEFAPRAPLAATPGMFKVDAERQADRGLGVSVVENDANVTGLLAMGVPAAVAGLCDAHRRFGRLPLSVLLAPAIALAHDGFAADSYFALEVLANADALRADPMAASIFMRDGLPPAAPHLGQATLGVPHLIRQPQLGRTLELVANGGHAAFYDGEVADALLETCREGGGLLSRDDLAACAVKVGAPRRLRFRDADIWAPDAPCGAITQLQMLAAWQVLHPDGAGDLTSSERIRQLAEISWHAFADRYHYLGDPDFVPVPEQALLSPAYAGHVARLVETGSPAPRATREQGPPWRFFASTAAHDAWAFQEAGAAEPHWSAEGATESLAGTTHISVADRDGAIVSLTYTAANHFGSKFVCPRTGLLLDAAMGWFNAVPGAANSIAGGKRPLANMGPLIVSKAGMPFAALGAPGGRRIIPAVVQLVLSIVEDGMNAVEAVAAPRIDASGSTLLVSERLAEAAALIPELEEDVRFVAEEHEAFGYELARPVVVGRDRDGAWMPAVDPYTRGCGLVL